MFFTRYGRPWSNPIVCIHFVDIEIAVNQMYMDRCKFDQFNQFSSGDFKSFKAPYHHRFRYLVMTVAIYVVLFSCITKYSYNNRLSKCRRHFYFFIWIIEYNFSRQDKRGMQPQLIDKIFVFIWSNWKDRLTISSDKLQIHSLKSSKRVSSGIFLLTH